MAADSHDPYARAELASELLSAMGSRLEDRGHDDSPELVAAVCSRAIVDAIRELAAEVRWARQEAAGGLASLGRLEAHAATMAKALDSGLL